MNQYTWIPQLEKLPDINGYDPVMCESWHLESESESTPFGLNPNPNPDSCFLGLNPKGHHTTPNPNPAQKVPNLGSNPYPDSHITDMAKVISGQILCDLHNCEYPAS